MPTKIITHAASRTLSLVNSIKALGGLGRVSFRVATQSDFEKICSLWNGKITTTLAESGALLNSVDLSPSEVMQKIVFQVMTDCNIKNGRGESLFLFENETVVPGDRNNLSWLSLGWNVRKEIYERCVEVNPNLYIDSPDY